MHEAVKHSPGERLSLASFSPGTLNRVLGPMLNVIFASRRRSGRVNTQRPCQALKRTTGGRLLTVAFGNATRRQRQNNVWDGMSKAFVFPGQGSQVVGMGKALAEDFPQARAVIAEVDEALGQNCPC